MLIEKLFTEISLLINANIFAKLRSRSLTTFLIGAGQSASDSLRDNLKNELARWRYIYWIDIYYPEQLFEELMKSSGNFDLLSLENLLAKSVHAIVIILESPGAIAELGAFTNHPELKDKLIVIVDKKYSKAKSFISLGPIRYLKNTKSIVLYHDFKDRDVSNLAEDVRKAIRKVSEGVILDNSIRNPIAAQHFLLAAIYVAEPVHIRILNIMIKNVIEKSSAAPINKEEVEAILSSALNILLYREEIILKDNAYLLTSKGLQRLRHTVDFGDSRHLILKVLDDFRVRILNVTLRGRNHNTIRRELSILSRAS